MRFRAAVVVILVLFCAACQSKPTPRLVWKDGQGGTTGRDSVTDSDPGSSQFDPEPDLGRADPAQKHKTVILPAEILEELNAFLEHPRFLLADKVTIEASRVPFRAQIIPVGDPRWVEFKEIVSPRNGGMGMLLVARTGRAKIEQEFPHVRVAGFDIAAAQQIQFRTWARVKESRPVFIRIVGVGNAVYKDEVTGRRIARDRIVIEAGVKNIEGVMSFSSYLK